MARLSAAERVRQGAKFLDKHWPKRELKPWFARRNAGEIDEICLWSLSTYKSLGKIFFWATRGMTDKTADSLGFRVPNFVETNFETAESYESLRKTFSDLLSEAWRKEILLRRETLPICKPTVCGRGISNKISCEGGEEPLSKTTAT